ncbi:Hypothetical_protein [Hexamita inflata]|uniref:Hypothetical_protein n=1 Tax=Hexamita inflata TaxID=28002 RepID=A0ABP1KTT7_9EUKA
MTVICFKHNERQQKQLSQRSEDSRISIQSIHYEVKSGSKGSLGKLVLPSMWSRSRIVFAKLPQQPNGRSKTKDYAEKSQTRHQQRIEYLISSLLPRTDNVRYNDSLTLCLPIFEDLFWRCNDN